MEFPSLSTSYVNPSELQSNNTVNTFTLPEECFTKGVYCTWRRGTQFSISTRSQTVSKTQPAACENKIVKLRKEVILFTGILRKLVNESNGTFLSLQKAAETGKISDSQVEFLKLSRQYRSIIRVCIESLQEAASKETDGVAKHDLESYITIFYSIECIWHLCEILFIDIIPGDVVLPHLLEWVRFHFPCHEQSAAQLLEACEKGCEDQPEYWNTVVGMAVQGRVDVARALMKLHTHSESNEFKLVDNSLKSMPVYSVYSGVSTGEFTISWKHWQAECRSKLLSRAFASHPQLELIMKLITGDYAAFEQLRANYESWFDLLGGWVMFTAPWSRKHELRSAASACAGMRGDGIQTHLDVMVRALLDGDLHQVIHESQQVADNGWFATHLTDLLFHCDKLKVLDKHQEDVTARLRESLVLEYGSMLMDHKSSWSIGLSYLAACPPEGLKRAELMLERIPIPTEAKAMRVVAEAKKYGLSNVVRTVSGSTGARLLSRGRIGAALSWGLRGRHAALCGRAAHAALRDYTARAALPAPDLLLTAGGSMLIATPLLFAGKYCEFHRMYKNREFKKAGELLISLITSKIAPDYFWETLLIDTLPLLESDEPVFSANGTMELMVCLELRGAGLPKEQAELLRLGLARNLARTALNGSDAEEE